MIGGSSKLIPSPILVSSQSQYFWLTLFCSDTNFDFEPFFLYASGIENVSVKSAHDKAGGEGCISSQTRVVKKS